MFDKYQKSLCITNCYTTSDKVNLFMFHELTSLVWHLISISLHTSITSHAKNSSYAMLHANRSSMKVGVVVNCSFHRILLFLFEKNSNSPNNHLTVIDYYCPIFIYLCVGVIFCLRFGIFVSFNLMWGCIIPIIFKIP